MAKKEAQMKGRVRTRNKCVWFLTVSYFPKSEGMNKGGSPKHMLDPRHQIPNP